MHKVDLKRFRNHNFNDPHSVTAHGYKDINWSSIQDQLIRLAAKHTENYASDILYDIRNIEDILDSDGDNDIETDFYFGFRELGIDNASYIKAKHEHELNETYRVIWRLQIAREDRETSMNLHRVSYDRLTFFDTLKEVASGKS